MGIYQNLYNLLIEYVYGGQVTSIAESVATLLATVGCIFCVALPFVLVWRVIRMIGGI